MPSGFIFNLTKPEDYLRLVPGFEANMLGSVRKAYGSGQPLEHVMIGGIPCVDTGKYWRLERSPKEGYNTVADMVALSYKPIHIPIPLLRFVSAYPRDGNELNLHPENLVWKFSKPLEVPWLEGFYYIPGYTRYAINRATLEIIKVENCTTLPQTKSESGGYIYCSVPNDIPGKRGLAFRYVASALAFNQVPSDVDQKAVNHINSVRTDDAPENLEWLFHEENIRHAAMRKHLGEIPPRYCYTYQEYDIPKIEALCKSKGLRVPQFVYQLLERPVVTEKTPESQAEVRQAKNAKRRVQRLDIATEEIVMFETYMDAVKASGLLSNQVYQSVNSDIFGEEGFGVVKGKWIFRYEGMGFPEINPISKLEMMRSGGTRRPVLMKNSATGKILEFEAVRVAAKELGLSHVPIFNALGEGKQPVIGTHWLVKFKDSSMGWDL